MGLLLQLRLVRCLDHWRLRLGRLLGGDQLRLLVWVVWCGASLGSTRRYSVYSRMNKGE
jgi:hypothetical protein